MQRKQKSLTTIPPKKKQKVGTPITTPKQVLDKAATQLRKELKGYE